MNSSISTPLGIFEDAYKYAHALNKIRLDTYGRERFIFCMILPSYPIASFQGPERIMEPPKCNVFGVVGYAR